MNSQASEEGRHLGRPGLLEAPKPADLEKYPLADCQRSAEVVMVFSAETYRAEEFLEAARKLGVAVVLASDARGATEELLGSRYVHVDLDDPEASAERLVSAVGDRPVSGVLALDDAAVRVAAIAASRLGTSTNSVAGVMATRDKAAFRRRMKEAGVPQPAFAVLDRFDGHLLEEALRQVGFPCVVKPPGLSASTGVLRADDGESLAEAVGEVAAIQARHAGRSLPLVVEEFLPGREVAVEGVLVDGDLEVLALIDKPEAPKGPTFPETLLVTPADLSRGEQAEAAEVVASAARALGIREGPVHAELREGSDGRFCILELAARTIGGLCSKALVFESGTLTLEEVVLRRLLGDRAMLGCGSGISGVAMLHASEAGKVRAVSGVEEAKAVPGVVGVEITVRVGSEVRPLPWGHRYLGFVFARAEKRADCQRALEAARAALRFEIDGGDEESAWAGGSRGLGDEWTLEMARRR